MDWLKNISINLRASGPAAVLCVYIIAVTTLGMYGSSPMGGLALGMLAIIGPILIASLPR